MAAKITYFAHDLSDPAVERRVKMLLAGGAAVTPIGFRRGARPITAIADVPAVEIGRSADGQLARRAIAVLSALSRLPGVAQHVRGTDVILARNLEMLIVAAQAQRLYAPNAKLIYECLDIHRMLLSEGLNGALLRFLESRLWRRVDLLLTSSPAFIRNYFAPRGFTAPIRLVENKLLVLDDNRNSASMSKRPRAPPWRIGWFGMIRCRKSLDILSSIAREMNGAIEVIIRGRPSGAVFPNFDEDLADRPHIHYAGPYRSPTDLSRIYGDVHFVWAIDYYESGQNSAWLMPNRLYEGTFYGAVPIGLADVESGAWLAKHAVGITPHEPLQERLIDFFQTLDQDVYTKLVEAITALPRTELASSGSDCCDLVRGLCQPLPASDQPGDDGEGIALARETRSRGV